MGSWVDGAGLRGFWKLLLDAGLVWSQLAWLVRTRDVKTRPQSYSLWLWPIRYRSVQGTKDTK